MPRSGCSNCSRVAREGWIGIVANERMVPILPCASIDVMREFWVLLGFEVTYRQVKPNPYLAVRREDLELHYFGMDGFRPEDSYGTCLVLVDDTEPLFEALAAGLRSRFGNLPFTGFPRITRPRRRKNAGNLTGFSLIDPSGNWIRVTRREGPGQAADAVHSTGGRLARVLENAIVLADSKGDYEQAAKILGGVLSRERDASAVDRVEALAYLAELSVRLRRIDRARELLDEIDGLEQSEAERRTAARALAHALDLRTSVVDKPGVAEP